MLRKGMRVSFCLPFVIAASLAHAWAQDLEQLKYNNPGLKVDLGVGLWAWPMPIDYDEDGDLDLLVACPDKPSNGVWYFENPSQDPNVKMPVFKPAVRLGKATQNMQVSYVDGKARILRPGFEYIDFRKDGFDKATKIYPVSNIHENKVRGNMWRYIDWEGDGDQDIIVGAGDWTDYGWDHAYDAQGRWQNGPLHGYVYLIEKDGENYSEPKRIQAGGADIDVYGWPCPSFADFDGDGDADLICGEFLDGFTYFENVGTSKAPQFARGQPIVAADGVPLKMDLQMITPVAIDWDQDGDMDLICGDEDGRVALIEQLPSAPSVGPHFAQPRYFQQEADTLKFGALATPFAFDWDADGDEDILCGNTAGHIGWFQNLGSEKGSTPKWAAPELLEDESGVIRIQAGPTGSIQGPCEAKWGYTTLSATTASDGQQDHQILAVNSIWGKLRTYSRPSGEGPLNGGAILGIAQEKPVWFWWDRIPPETISQWRTTPLQDEIGGHAGLIMLDSEGYLAIGTTPSNGTSTFDRIFIDEDNHPIRLNTRSAGRSGRYKLAIVDWDQDGRKDLLVNSENATWYRNCEDRNGKIVLKKIGNLGKRNVAGHTSSPAACDFDQDGKPDLLVGAENGRIYFAKHDDCIQYKPDQLKARAPKEPTPPRAPGIVKEEFVFTKAKFPQCHASTLCQNSRGLVVAWFGGTREKHEDVGVWVSYNDGAGWTSPVEVANGVQYPGHRHPCWNPVLFQTPGDQETQLYFKVGPDPRTWWGEVITSYDRGRTWRDRRRLPEKIDGPVKNKPVLLSDGTLLCGSSTEYEGWRVHFETTRDFGQTWERIGPINDASRFNAIQPTILQHGNSKLQILCRSREGSVVESWSEDNGQTWSKIEATSLPNPNAGFDAVTLQDGRHLLVYNHTTRNEGEWRGRNMLNVAISDDGKTWKSALILEQEKSAEFSYPAVIQGDDGLVHTTYTWKRQRIKHVVIDPAKLELNPIE